MLAEWRPPHTTLAYGAFRPGAMPHGGEGIGALARATGVGIDALRKLINGKQNSMSVEDCDKLSLHAYWTLEELVEEAQELADQGRINWPDGYIPGKHD